MVFHFLFRPRCKIEVIIRKPSSFSVALATTQQRTSGRETGPFYLSPQRNSPAPAEILRCQLILHLKGILSTKRVEIQTFSGLWFELDSY